MNSVRDVYVVGAGGHSKVVISTLQAGGWQVAAILDDDVGKKGQCLLGVPVLGPVDELNRLLAGTSFPRAVMAIGSNSVRRQVAERFQNIQWISAVHPRSEVHPSVKIGEGTVVFAGAVVQADSIIGNHSIINTSASVDHDCVIGDYTHIAPGSHLAGSVRLEEGVFLGIGTSVIVGMTIGKWSVLGAGAVVVNDIPAGVVAVGIPAKPIK